MVLEATVPEAHSGWVGKLARDGMETLSMEHLRHDPHILEPHELEDHTRLLLRLGNNQVTTQLWAAWVDGAVSLEAHVAREPYGKRPYHLQPLLEEVGRLLLRSLQQPACRLRAAIEELEAVASGTTPGAEASPATLAALGTSCVATAAALELALDERALQWEVQEPALLQQLRVPQVAEAIVEARGLLAPALRLDLSFRLLPDREKQVQGALARLLALKALFAGGPPDDQEAAPAASIGAEGGQSGEQRPISRDARAVRFGQAGAAREASPPPAAKGSGPKASSPAASGGERVGSPAGRSRRR